ncbi:hypothetical protein L6452_01259 [Arctium lappa]|uniref:Uncharacterized protein n=1 Tax=Arctium lappa TaxID=4217 RepID=A0ACB9FGE3_ARCLA|nr:hypothetical protein L6452_01259 [Arctium lappa]
MVKFHLEFESEEGFRENVDVGKKATKKKRVELVISLEERDCRIDALREEVDGLIKYYKEYNNSGNVVFNVDSVKVNCSGNSLIACLLEESSLPLSKLMESITDRVKEEDS